MHSLSLSEYYSQLETQSFHLLATKAVARIAMTTVWIFAWPIARKVSCVEMVPKRYGQLAAQDSQAM